MLRILCGEFLGSAFLIIFGGGVVAGALLNKSKAQNGGWMAITAGWGLGVMIAVFIAQSVGSVQADLNPAVTMAKFLLGNVYTSSQILPIMAAQLLGCFVGAFVVWLAYFPHWRETPNPDVKLGVFCTSPAISSWKSNLLCEIIGTGVLVLCIGGIFNKASHGVLEPGFGPYLVGMLVWAIGLSLGGPTGYAINPARDLGPRLAHSLLPISGKGSSHWGYAWVPIVGPLVGACLAAMVWKFLLLK
jgi:glycerol uptake facilitator protein